MAWLNTKMVYPLTVTNTNRALVTPLLNVIAPPHILLDMKFLDLKLSGGHTFFHSSQQADTTRQLGIK